MCESLWPQLRLKAETEEELIAAYRAVYEQTYVFDEQGQRRQFSDWNGHYYQFSKWAFDHAFSESDNYRVSAGVHHKWSMKRLRRMLWIKEVLALSNGTVQRYVQSRKAGRSNRNAKRRTLVVVEERYVVVFDDPREKDKPYQFVTAFPADASYMARLTRDSMLLETRRVGL